VLEKLLRKGPLIFIGKGPKAECLQGYYAAHLCWPGILFTDFGQQDERKTEKIRRQYALCIARCGPECPDDQQEISGGAKREQKRNEKVKVRCEFPVSWGQIRTKQTEGSGNRETANNKRQNNRRPWSGQWAWPFFFLRRMHSSNVLAFCTPSSVHVAFIAWTSFFIFFRPHSVFLFHNFCSLACQLPHLIKSVHVWEKSGRTPPAPKRHNENCPGGEIHSNYVVSRPFLYCVSWTFAKSCVLQATRLFEPFPV
jgi:hypothetical protein